MFDMNAMEAVTLIATFGGLLVTLTPPFRLGRGLSDLGRQGTAWFEHDEDRALEERPSEDALDAPLPHRPLRTRF